MSAGLHAAIDIGTHSTRLLVGTVGPEGVRTTLRVTTVTKLGTGVDASRQLNREAIDRTITALERYRIECDQLYVTATGAVATSALRDVDKADLFLDKAEEVLGVRPKVISGEQEARLTFQGAERSLRGNGSLSRQMSGRELMVFDIGGGSTEFVTRSRQLSTDLGCLRLTERFLLSDPPAPGELFALREYCRQQLSSAMAQLFGYSAPGNQLFTIGVAGTVTSMVAMLNELDPYDPAQVHQMPLRAVDVESLLGRLAGLSLDERKKVRGLQPSRADVIVAGTGILATILEVVGLQTIIVSESDILDGILISTFEGAHA